MKTSTIWFILIAFLACLVYPSQSVSAQTQGQKIAGTYWVEIFRDGFGFAPPALMTMTADGRIMGDQQTGPFQSSVFGNWEKVGDRGARGKFLGFLYEPSGDPNSIIEVSFAGEFDQSGDNGELAVGG